MTLDLCWKCDFAPGGDPSAVELPFERAMLAEVLHRTANDMQIVQAYLNRAKRQASSDVSHINAAIAHVDRIANVQRLLIPPLARGPVDLKTTLEKICLAMSRATLEDQGIEIKVAVSECVLEARDCWIISTIVVELITNAARHAFAGTTGTIFVAGRREGRVLIVGVADEGVTAAASGNTGIVRRVIGGGRGNGIVDVLLAALGGTMRRSPGPKGTRVELWIGL